VGASLARALASRGWLVTVVDDLSSGRLERLASLAAGRLEVLVAKVEDQGLRARLGSRGFDVVAHLASPASPRHYLARPFDTLRANAAGTEAMAELAAEMDAYFLYASSSEVYGAPSRIPTAESDLGPVDPLVPRSCYAEAKRFGEALVASYVRHKGLTAGIVRIFNAYGPEMDAADGRVVPSFIAAALKGRPLVITGSGRQTRSFCYIDDLVDGLVATIESRVTGPMNLGNPEEISIVDLARKVIELTGSPSSLEFVAGEPGDPVRRCPDITRARELLGFEPATPLEAGLRRCIEHMAAGG
jgi:dTDP-glucose 4,6-dehydratase